MHELSLCEAVADAVTARAAARRVTRATLRVGYLRQVVPDALTLCWSAVTDGTSLDGCALDVEHVPAVVECRACGRSGTLDLPVMLCPSCDDPDVALLSGDELLLVSIDLQGGP